MKPQSYTPLTATPRLKSRKTYKKLGIVLSVLVAWVLFDLYYPYKTNLKNINPTETARLEGLMWRSYYEKKPLLLFWQSANLMRSQFHAPFWRSNVMAFHAAKAAFIFKKGTKRVEYEKALPNLRAYFEQINNLSKVPFDVEKVTQLELEWWIIRRYRQQYPPAEWEKLLAQEAALLYHMPTSNFTQYAHLRTQAMLLRDEKGIQIAENDWNQINYMLQKAWESFKIGLL